ncbi:MAG: tetratricopeptide repeat protein [Candidatus Obscuribacterales bacterium]
MSRRHSADEGFDQKGMNQVPKMPRFNLTNLSLALSLMLINSGSSLAQVSASDAAIVREHVNKGNVHMARGQWEQAIDEYEQALDADPGSMVAKENLVLVHNNWGIFLFQRHKYEEAKAQWEEALKMNPYDRNAKNNLSVLKSTLARINAAPKPPVKPPAETKDGIVVKGTPAGAGSAETKDDPPADASSGPKMLNTSKQEPPGSAGSGPKVLNAIKQEESSGPKVLNQAKSADIAPAAEPSGGVVIMQSGNQALSVPDVPAPPAVPPQAPEPPQVSAPPAIDMSSPYSFVDTPAAKATAESSSPYGLPANMSTSGSRQPRPYIAPQATPTPARPNNAWTVPASVSGITESTSNAATTSTAATSESDSSANLEEQLEAIEMKLTGKKQKNMPILKRIEKLETSISGKSSSGSLQERIEALRKSCGL